MRQYWQSSIQTRNEPAEIMHQRAAAEDDFRSQAMGLYDSLVQEHIEAKMPQAAKDDLQKVIAAEPAIVEDEDEPLIIAPEDPVGPILKPLSAGVPWW